MAQPYSGNRWALHRQSKYLIKYINCGRFVRCAPDGGPLCPDTTTKGTNS